MITRRAAARRTRKLEPTRTGLAAETLTRAVLDNLAYLQARFPDDRHPARLVHGARLQRARPAAGALGAHGADLRRARREGRLLPLGRVPDRPAARQQPGQPRHRGGRARGDARRSARTWTRCSRSKRSRASATAASAGWRPAISIRSPRSRCRRSATASATSSASSIRRSATAGRWR